MKPSTSVETYRKTTAESAAKIFKSKNAAAKEHPALLVGLVSAFQQAPVVDRLMKGLKVEAKLSARMKLKVGVRRTLTQNFLQVTSHAPHQLGSVQMP